MLSSDLCPEIAFQKFALLRIKTFLKTTFVFPTSVAKPTYRFILLHRPGFPR